MSSSSVKPGDVLAGKYRVERVLGAGGMGYVVAARHLQLDQMVAMKFLRSGAVENAEAGARFLREAKAVVKLRNEHIAKVFDVGTLESGEPYIVMEYLDGYDLSQLAKQRPVLPVAEACEYVMQACEALAEAHALGIIHRDIKLANLFVTRGPAGGPLVKVLDFGISKTNPFGEAEHEMTRTASMLGSPRFMSPEQMRDPRAVDARSDIWSLGVVLYRLIAGRPPFEADTLGRLLTMVMHEIPPPLASVRHDLPPGVSELVDRCLEKNPSGRFTNVAELAHALVPFMADPTHGRSAADRICAMLSAPMHPPITGSMQTGPMPAMPMPISLSGRPRRPSDTGTAAPWSGTHGGGRSRAPASTVGLGVVFAALLVGAFIYGRYHYGADAAHENAPSAASTATVVPAPEPVPVQTIEPAVSAVASATSIPVPRPVETVPPAPPPPAPAAAAPAVPAARRSVATPPRPRVASPPSPPRTSPPAPAPRNEEGIPSTRD
jgi:serine/threonine-protein kinase